MEPFLSNRVYKRYRTGPRGGASPYKSLFELPPGGEGFRNVYNVVRHLMGIHCD